MNNFSNVFASKLNLTIQIIAADISSTLNQFYFICFPLSDQNYNNVYFDLMSLKFSLGTYWGFEPAICPTILQKKSQLFSPESLQGKHRGKFSDAYIF